MKRSDKDAALDELNSHVPRMKGCDGRCWISCGPVDMSDRERARIREAGYKITPAAEAVLKVETYWCEALTEDHRCAVYERRPLICRIWGAAEELKCPYGCVPEGGFLSNAEVDGLLTEAERIGGNGLPTRNARRRAADALAQAAIDGGIKIREQYNLPAAFRPKTEDVPCPRCGFMLTLPPGPTIGRCAHCMRVILLG